MDNKLCKSCGETKPLNQFTASRNSYHFKIKDSHHAYCRVCNAKRAKVWRDKHPGYRGTGRIKKVPQEDRLLMSMIRQRLVEAKSRARKFSLPETEVDDWYLYRLFKDQGGKCALLGYDMLLEKKHALCPSLDQIESGKGYVEGNVQWVAWVANRAKGDLSTEDFYQMCRIAIEYREQRNLQSRDIAGKVNSESNRR